jgi:four helix bundle protein
MHESVLADKSKAFAIRIVRLYQFLSGKKKERVLSEQILRSGTSIGANIAEARYASSKKDFLGKMTIALKEASETVFWLELLKETEYLTEKQFADIHTDCDALLRLLISSTKTLKASLPER